LFKVITCGVYEPQVHLEDDLEKERFLIVGTTPAFRRDMPEEQSALLSVRYNIARPLLIETQPGDVAVNLVHAPRAYPVPPGSLVVADVWSVRRFPGTFDVALFNHTPLPEAAEHTDDSPFSAVLGALRVGGILFYQSPIYHKDSRRECLRVKRRLEAIIATREMRGRLSQMTVGAVRHGTGGWFVFLHGVRVEDDDSDTDVVDE
jgi:hypothetical protein